MAYEIHEKTTEQGSLFRVWSTSTDGYWQKPLTRNQLEDVLLAYSVERAAGDLIQRFAAAQGGRPLRTVKVQKWYRERKNGPIDPEGYLEEQLAEIYGAKITTNVETAPDGTKTITVKIQPLPKK